MTLLVRALDPDDVPADLVRERDLRGIAVYWQAPTLGLKADAAWSVQRVAFHAVHPAHQDLPPADADDVRRYAVSSYALVASSHPIPSDADIFYEIGR